MDKVIKHRILIGIFLFLLIIGNSFVFSNQHSVYANKKGKELNIPDDIVDPGPVLPEHLIDPQINKISNNNKGITINWKKVKDADGYRIQRKSGKGKWKDLKIINKTQYTDTTVKNGENYQYRIYAYVASSVDFIESPGTKSITKKLLHLKVSSINSKKTSKNKGYHISWKKNSKADGYKVQISKSKDFKKNYYSRKISSAKKIYVNINNLKKNKTFYIRVCAYKCNGKNTYYSAWSNIKKIK